MRCKRWPTPARASPPPGACLATVQRAPVVIGGVPMRHAMKLDAGAVMLTGSGVGLVCEAPAAVEPPAAAKAPSKPTECTTKERSDVLQDMKQTVLKVAPPRIASLDQAIKPGGPLAGWRLAHLHAVLAGAGGVAIDNASAHTKFPQPQ